MHKIIESDAALKPILSVGAKYTYVPRRVFQKYPGLDAIAQSAGNYIQGVAKAEHDIQQLLKVASRLEAGTPFTKIREQVKKAKCNNLEALSGMFQFVRKYGGEEGNMAVAKATAHNIRSEADTKRRIGADVWDALGLDYKGVQQLPCLRHAIVGLIYTDPNQRIVTAGDIKRMGDKANIGHALAFENALHQMAQTISASGAPFDAAVAREQHAFAKACAALACKSLKAKVLADIVNEFTIEDDQLALGHLMWLATRNIFGLADVSEAVKDALRKAYTDHADQKKLLLALTPRPPNKSQAASSTADPKNQKDSIDMDAVGVRGPDVSLSIMKELGWSVGDGAQQKPEKGDKGPVQKWKIVSIKEGTVTMQHADAPADATADAHAGAPEKKVEQKQVDVAEFQKKEWTKTKVQEHVIVPATAPTVSMSREFGLELIKSVAFIALAEAVQKQENEDLCQVRLKPHKAVEVTEDIPKGKLALAPSTTTLQILEKEKVKDGFDAFNRTSLLLGSFVHESQQYCMFALGSPSIEASSKKAAKRSLFWGVNTTDKESEANCKLDQSIPSLKIHPEKIEQWMSSSANTNQVAKIPMIISTKALKAGDALFIFQPNKKQRTN